MIVRAWRGWTTLPNANAYHAFLEQSLFPSMSAMIVGFRGGHVLRREDADEVEFLILTTFDSLEDVQRFAGEDHENAVIEPDARALLKRWEPRTSHYETDRL